MTDLELAKRELIKTDYRLVVVKNQEIVADRKERGVNGLIYLYENQPELLKNASIADRIIGRAAAMICSVSKIDKCYTPIISQGAIEILEDSNIDYQYEKIVPAITNRDNTGLCPLEKLTLEIEDSKKGVEKIQEFLAIN